MQTKIYQANDIRVKKEVRPFLKWPGGKQWLASQLIQIIRTTLTNTYFEPFLGAGAIFLKLGPKKSILSDINKELINCILTVRNNPNEVIQTLWRWSNTENCYDRIRKMQPIKPVTAAARFIYLSKTCWGGIFRVNKNGQFNVPFGGSGRTICRKENLLACARIFKKAEITCSDFEPIIDMAGEGDVVYADPPYTTIGQNNGFIRYNERLFAWKDQERLAAACKRASERKTVVIVSGLWHESLLDLYSNWNVFKIERISRISAKKEGRKKIFEALFLNIK